MVFLGIVIEIENQVKLEIHTPQGASSGGSQKLAGILAALTGTSPKHKSESVGSHHTLTTFRQFLYSGFIREDKHTSSNEIAWVCALRACLCKRSSERKNGGASEVHCVLSLCLELFERRVVGD